MVAKFTEPCLRWVSLQRALACGALYFIVASATILITSNGRDHSAVWLADAIVLAALLVLPRRNWGPLLLAGVIANHLANDVTRGSEIAHIMYGLINMGQVWIAASLIRRQPVKSLLADIGSFGQFVLWAGLIAPVVGAALGSLVSLCIYDQPFAQSFIRWFASNSLGLMVGTPLLKAAFDGTLKESFKHQTFLQRRNMAAALAVYTLVVHVTFSQQQLPLLFLPVCALVMVAIWLGRIGVKVAVLILAVVATVATIDGYGPLGPLALDEFRKATFFQVYLGILLATGMIVVTIVTYRSDAMARLADREQMLHQLLMHGTYVVLSLDAKGRCTFCAGPTISLLGLSAEEIVGCNIIELAELLGIPMAMVDAQEYALRPRPSSIEFQLAGNRRAWIEGSMTPVLIDECLTSSVVTLRDITSQRLQNDDLRRLALTDELTQVLNRAGFERQIQDALHGRRPATLALIDIDNFKAVNDTYGHFSGDEVLVVVAEIIGAHVRDCDAVGRMGGDEFAVLFRGGPDAALAACQRICSCVHDTPIFATDRRQIRVTISCGIAGMPPNQSRGALFGAADLALYEVKRRGRNGARLAA